MPLETTSTDLILTTLRFDDPKVSSIAFLTKKAQLIASDVDDSTDDDYSPKTKRYALINPQLNLPKLIVNIC